MTRSTLLVAFGIHRGERPAELGPGAKSTLSRLRGLGRRDVYLGPIEDGFAVGGVTPGNAASTANPRHKLKVAATRLRCRRGVLWRTLQSLNAVQGRHAN
jgi:hypothetical protein